MGPRRKAIAQIEAPQRNVEMGRSTLQSLAITLQSSLTQRLTAYIVGLADGRDIGRYARGERVPHIGTLKKLSDLFSLLALIKESEPPEMIQVWFLGRNPEFGDRSPASMLHEDFEGNFLEVKKALLKFFD
jgi:hypothetical protein